MKINSKILAAFVPGVALAAVIIRFVIVPSLESALRKSVDETRLLFAQQTLGNIDRLLNTCYNNIQSISRDSIFLERLRGRTEERAVSVKMADWLELTGPWDAMMLIDSSRIVRAASEKRWMGRAIEDAEELLAFKRAMKGAVYYSDLVSSARTGRTTVLFAAPVLASDTAERRVKGVVLGHFSWAAVHELVDETAELSRDKIFNKDGILIASDDRDESAGLRREAPSEGLRRALERKSGAVVEPAQDGRGDVSTIYAPQLGYLNYKGNGWAITAQTPDRVVFGPIKNSVFILSLILSFCIGLSFLAAIVIVMTAVSKPIIRFTGVVREIAAGNSSNRAEVSSDDELGELAAAFNKMLDDLWLTTVSKKFLNGLLDGIQDQIVVTDTAGSITLVNPSVVNLLGYTEAELIGSRAAMLFDDAPPFAGALDSLGAQFLTKSGVKIPILFSLSALKSDDGTVTGYLGAAKDISGVRKLEARMQQSEKMSAIGQLAAGVAHEINNPLGVILGFAQAMSREIKPGDDQELPVKSIEREALRCKALVQNLLTFARTSHSDRVPMDLNGAIANARTLIEPQAKMARVVISTSMAENLPPVLGNKGQLEQVIINLAKNAIDAMPGGGSFGLSTELVSDAAHSWILLKFADDGAGIPPAVISKIFDPFFTTKPIGQGTGLGLSLVSEIVQKHSGELSVESRPGRTVFTIRLPARTGDELDKYAREIQNERVVSASAGSFAKGIISRSSPA